MLTRTALALLLLLPTSASAQELDTAVSAVVRISGTRGDTPVRGSGFVVSRDGDKATIVTAAHVIEGLQRLEITFAADPTERFPVDVVRGMESGSRRGLAVVQVRGAIPAAVTKLGFDTEAQLHRGEDLFLLGFPEMATAPLTVRRTFAGPNGNFLQLDLPVGEGFSGAPVLRAGKVLGVVTDEDLSLTFAVKALVARDAVLGWGVELDGKAGDPAPKRAAPAKPKPPSKEPCAPGKETAANGIVFIRICPGTFTMGSAEKDPRGEDDEKPAHRVTLSEFWITETEITNEQYRSFRPDRQGEATLPATRIRWVDAEAACEHFGGRLPTEAEWEYAARGGSETTWSFGDDETKLADYAWFDKNSGDKPHPVRTKGPNPWGLYDMHGNVWEWVADRFDPYLSEPQIDPHGPEKGELRGLRGGGFDFPANFQRSAFRNRNRSSIGNRSFGFRCARDPRRQP